MKFLLSRLVIASVLMPLLASCATDADRASRMDAWNAKVIKRIDARKYMPIDPLGPPRIETGLVVLSVPVHRTGAISTPRVVESSGSPMLDSAAVIAVSSANPFPPPPYVEKDFIEVYVPVMFATSQEEVDIMTRRLQALRENAAAKREKPPDTPR